MLKSSFVGCVLIAISCLVSHAQTVTPWPRTFTSDGATYTVYQPQVTVWSGVSLSARAAVSVLPQGAASPLFGTVVVTGTTLVDQPSQTVSLTNLSVTSSSFPTAGDQASTFAAAIVAQSGQWSENLSLKSLQANLAVTQAEGGANKTVPVVNTPPKIYFSEGAAILVLVDGQPALRSIPGSSLLRAINTQSLLVMDQGSGTYYLRANGGWAQSSSLDGPWSAVATPSDQLQAALAAVKCDSNVQLFDPPSGTTPPMPVIFVSTVPAELVTTQGPPQFQPVPNTNVLYVTNSGSSLFMDVTSQNYYVVISGRWFTSASLQGPWQFVAANALPADFANIPVTHPAGTVLASVAKTPQAREAAIASTIPQTATISKSATASVDYAGGTPEFSTIEGTSLQYAKNSATPVIQVSDDEFYAVVNGVWFKSSSPAGPWRVADKVPPVIYTIPPSSPVFYVTNVYVYDSTPDTVFVGYTPGYFGTCLAPEGVVVFGTGYPYVPYIGPSVWIGPPLTYGFGAGFACGLATGFAFGLAFDHGWGCSPWWGPWHGGWGDANVNINRNWNNVNVNHNNVYNRWGNNVNVSNNNVGNNNRWKNHYDNNGNRIGDGNRIGNRNDDPIRRDNDGGGIRRDDDPLRSGDDSWRPDDGASHHRNLGDDNVFAGDDGHAYRSRDDGGWQRFDNSGGWSNADRGAGNLDSDRFSRSGGFGGGFHGGFGGRR